MELAASIAGPICLICIVSMVIVCISQQRRIARANAYRGYHSDLSVETENLMVTSRLTLNELMEAGWSHSGSGSGNSFFMNFNQISLKLLRLLHFSMDSFETRHTYFLGQSPNFVLFRNLKFGFSDFFL